MAIETMCFIISEDKVLMINRNKPPFMGMWNVIGGKGKENESPEDCVKREVYEESGIQLKKVELLSIFTWNYDENVSYAFTAELPSEYDTAGYPKNTQEGILDFKSIDWLINPKNFGIVEDLRLFINNIKNGVKKDYHLVYKDSKLKKVKEKRKD